MLSYKDEIKQLKNSIVSRTLEIQTLKAERKRLLDRLC